MFAVREPFPSKPTQTSHIFGVVTNELPLIIHSQMTGNGVIFSDGIEGDYLEFNVGATVTIALARHKVRFVA
ncbi:MAG: hypothetical protein HY272_03750 [Gammaproteobacteria bacterium]|nr:hypothetical protein [Gammaproteobacteria bacterium]